VAQRVGDAGDKRHFRADDDEVDAQLARKGEQSLGVLGAHGMTRPEAVDAGIPRRAVELGEPRALCELPRERVLAPARADEEHVHALDPMVV
jgi:hypothetical protein